MKNAENAENAAQVANAAQEVSPTLKELVKPQTDEKDDFVEAYCQEGYSSGDTKCASGYSYFWGYGAGAEEDVLL